MLTALLLPADERQSVRLEHLSSDELPLLQGLVRGNVETLRLSRPTCTMYVNEEGKQTGMPENRKATAILWIHNSAFSGYETIVGDVFILGPPDQEGHSTTAPDDLVQLLLHTERYRVQVRTMQDSKWSGNDLVFDTWYDAYVYGIRLSHNWTLVEDVRIIPDHREEEQRLIAEWFALGRENPWIHEAHDPPFRIDSSFQPCYTVEELEEEIGRANWSLGTAFFYRDLCLINQVNAGDEWLAIRHGIPFESFTFGPFIERGEFASLIGRLLAATREQCERLEY